jgi:hypothetical protein
MGSSNALLGQSGTLLGHLECHMCCIPWLVEAQDGMFFSAGECSVLMGVVLGLFSGTSGRARLGRGCGFPGLGVDDDVDPFGVHVYGMLDGGA